MSDIPFDEIGESTRKFLSKPRAAWSACPPVPEADKLGWFSKLADNFVVWVALAIAMRVAALEVVSRQ
jgi:hypothetical protein